jgi:hypothetical protein
MASHRVVLPESKEVMTRIDFFCGRLRRVLLAAARRGRAAGAG